MLCNPKVNCQQVVNPTTIYDNAPYVPGHVYKSNRYLCIGKRLREHLLSWYQWKLGKYGREAAKNKLHHNIYGKMKRALQEKGYEALLKFMIWIEDHLTEQTDKNQVKVKHFFRSVIASETIYEMSHVQLVEILAAEGFNGNTFRNLGGEVKLKFRAFSPLISDLLLSDTSLDKSFYDLVRDMALQTKKLYDHSTAKLAHDEVAPTDEQLEYVADFTTSGQWYGTTMKRVRPDYKTDEINKGKKDKEDTVCTKDFAKFVGLNGGIFVAHCGLHPFNLGFHVIPICEGLNDFFSYMYCHFKHPPKTNSSDFNCGGSGYCMRREPEFFKDTVFIIDHAHHNGHTACSDAYSSFHFKKKGINDYKLINSATSEQRNRVLGKIKLMAQYMNFGNFMITVRHMLEMDNIKCIRIFNGCKIY